MSARTIWEELIAGRWTVLAAWLAAGRGEELHLDFKDAAFDPSGAGLRDTDQKNLAKGLSGFGNTEGGVLLFGPTTTKGPDKVDRLSGLTGIARLGDYAERLRALVGNITTPTIPGVAVEAFENPTAANTGVVGVYVPLGDSMPFRAEGPAEVKGRYFIRSTTDTTLMPHQILAAMFGRSPHPRLRLGFARKDVRKVQLFVENTGRGSAECPLVRVYVDRGADIDAFAFEVRQPWRDCRGDVYLGGHGPAWHAAAGLLGDQRVYPGEVRLVGTFDFLRNDPTIRARIDCANAPPILIEQKLALGDAISWLVSSP